MKHRRFYFELFRMLGFLPRKISLYRLAFLPKSAVQNEPPGTHLNNERLEYLGDAVLDAIVADYLFNRFPEGDEGFMTKLRSRIVKRKNLDNLAAKMDIPRLISPTVPKEHQAKHLYGNVLEALMGAIYIDRGYSAARRFFVRKIIRRHIDLVKLAQKDTDYKSRIIEWAQKNRKEIVFDSQVGQEQGNRQLSFISNLLLNGTVSGTGKGGSKKEAEQLAAKQALSTLDLV